MKSTSRSHTKRPTRRPRLRQRFARCRTLWSLVWRAARRLIPCMWRLGRRGGWAIHVLWWLSAHLWRGAQHAGGWLLNQLLAPCLCFACIYGGVLLTLLLPTSLWSALVSPDIT